MTDHGFKMGERVRTSFDGEVFPGVYEISGFGDDNNGIPGAHLESRDGDKTWSPLSDLHRVTDPPPGPLTHKQENRVREFVEFIDGLKPEAGVAALELLRFSICVHCGARLNSNHPVCYCTRDD